MRVHPQSTDPIEREYYRRLSQYVQTFRGILTEELYSALPEIRENARAVIPESLRHDFAEWRMDAKGADKAVAKLFATVQKRLEKTFPRSVLLKWASSMVGGVSRLSKKNAAAYVRAKKQAEIEPLLTDKGLSPYFRAIVAQNVGLIESIPEQSLPKLRQRIVALVTADKPVGDIAEAIQKEFKTTKRKAMLIARDQTSKLNGALNKHRQTQMGVTRYRWRTMGDERVRPRHHRVNGKVFSWDDPPPVGTHGERLNPGEDFQCRCYADPILGDLLG